MTFGWRDGANKLDDDGFIIGDSEDVDHRSKTPLHAMVGIMFGHHQEDANAEDKVEIRRSGERRLTKTMEMSFPEVDQDEARRFAEVGSTLNDCSRRRSTCDKLRRKRHTFHFNVDESWQYLQWAASPSAPSKGKWHLSDVSAVHPLVLDDGRINRNLLKASVSSRGSRRAAKMLLEFEAVCGRRRVKFRADTRSEVKLWVTALQSHLIRRGRSVVMEIAELATGHFQKADTNDDGALEFSEVKTLLKALNLRPSSEYLTELFRTFDKDGNASISEEEFKELFGKMLEKVHLMQFFNKYSVSDDGEDKVGRDGGERIMPCLELVRFLTEVQKELGHTEDSVREYLLADLDEPFVTREGGALTEGGFSYLMCSRKNSLLDPEFSKLHQDMSQPLSAYWINSSHNTYLEGAQIAGNASVEQYLEVLSQGCRCVEIDLWDGPAGEPIVTHGYTLSSKISFEEVAQALADHAFDHSEFPLILSLENHCSKQQIVRVGAILEEVFGDRLLRHPDGYEGEKLVSPLEARRRVLIKGSLVKLPGLEEDEDGQEDGILMTESSPSSKPSKGSASSRGSSIPFLGWMKRSASTLSRSSSRRFSKRLAKQRFTSAELLLGVRTFNSLIYLVAKKSHSIFEDRQPCNISSFSAPKAAKQCKNNGQVLNEYHRNHLSRIYPPGHNVSSGNFAPLLHWVHGAQLVALNFQTMDTSLLINEGIFREQNGGFGYVLKPSAVMYPDAAWEAQELKLTLTVLSAHFLPRPASMATSDTVTGDVTNPLVVIRLHEPESEHEPLRSCWPESPAREGAQYETSVKGDGFAPAWNETFELKVTRQDVSIISFEVFHHDPKWSKRSWMAGAAYPVSGLREGVRWVPLWDENRRPVLNCGMLVRLNMARTLTGKPFHKEQTVGSRGSFFSDACFAKSTSTLVPPLTPKRLGEVLMEEPTYDSELECLRSDLDAVEEVDEEEEEGDSEDCAVFGPLRVHRTYVAV